ncbi:MAG: methyltransferase domain-containing protein [Chitinophagales bacterium]|nr:methyltransferase domain-containing protein [Chitinophagales bacterium]
MITFVNMILKILHESSFLRKKYFNNWGRKWTQRKIDHVSNYIRTEESIVDIGCGNGLLTHMLREHNYNVTPVDIEDLSYSPLVKPIVYNGVLLPFENDEFQTGLLIAVLHHTKDPIELLKETSRIANDIVILEDVFYNRLQKWMLFLIDALINLGYSDLNFSHKTDREWKEIFTNLNLEVVEEKRIKTLLIFNQIIYYVKWK